MVSERKKRRKRSERKGRIKVRKRERKSGKDDNMFLEKNSDKGRNREEEIVLVCGTIKEGDRGTGRWIDIWIQR